MNLPKVGDDLPDWPCIDCRKKELKIAEKPAPVAFGFILVKVTCRHCNQSDRLYIPKESFGG